MNGTMPIASLVTRLAAQGRRLAQPACYALVGLSNTALDIGAFYVLTTMFAIPPLPSNVLSFSLGALNSFLLNRFVTFSTQSSSVRMAGSFWRFVAVTLVCLAVSSLTLLALAHFVPVLAAKLISVVVTFVIGFALNKHYVFR